MKIQTTGMHCQSCEVLVKDVLGDLDGVDTVDVDFKTGVIDIDFNGITIDDIKAEIKKLGYEIK